jgi:hypothetical protein
MRELLIAIFAFVLIASPYMAHHASGTEAHGHSNISSHEHQVGPSDQCESGCDAGLQITCCSQAITHCSPTFSYNELWSDVAPDYAVKAYFTVRQNPYLALMSEAETPPPRV